MICFDVPGCRFNYRVAGIARNAGRILLHRGEHEDFWTLPGGRVESMESARVALAREMREELQVNARIGGLRFLTENFYRYYDLDLHEIGLYFSMRFSPRSAVCRRTEPFMAVETNGLRVIFEWVRLEDVPRRVIKPDFLAEALLRSRRGIKHLVIDERS